MGHEIDGVHNGTEEELKASARSHLKNAEEYDEHAEAEDVYDYNDLFYEIKYLNIHESRARCLRYLMSMRQYAIREEWHLATKTFRSLVNFMKEHRNITGEGFTNPEKFCGRDFDLTIPRPSEHSDGA